MRSKRAIAGVVADLLAIGGATAAVTTITVTEADLGTTVGTRVVGDASGFAISTDVGAPVGFGTGALQLFTEDDNSARAGVGAALDTPLDGLADVSYRTFQRAGNSPYAAVSLRLGIDSEEGFTTLVFEPYWQDEGGPAGDGAPIVADEWQEWLNAEDGAWWSSRSVGGLTAGAGGPPLYTLAEAAAALTNATVVSWELGIGSYNRNWSVYADGLTIAGSSFDFDPAPLTKDDCKMGGWHTITGPNGEEFRNQGGCVSFFASDGRSRG